jgi:hypothetical protein
METSHRQKETQQLLASHGGEDNQYFLTSHTNGDNHDDETSHYMEITQSVIAERQTMKETQVYRTSQMCIDSQCT